MRSVAGSILLAVIAWAKEPIGVHTGGVQASTYKLADKQIDQECVNDWADKLVDKMFNRVFQVSHQHRTDLDISTLGKGGHLLTTPHTIQRALPIMPQPGAHAYLRRAFTVYGRAPVPSSLTVGGSLFAYFPALLEQAMSKSRGFARFRVPATDEAVEVSANVDRKKRSTHRRKKRPGDEWKEYRVRINEAMRDGRVHDGLAAFEELHAAGFQADIKTCNHVLNLLLSDSADRWQDMQLLFSNMTKHYEPDETSFTTMIRASEEMKRLDLGLQYYVQMRKAGIIPRLRTFSSLLRTCKARPDGGLQHALFLLGDAIRENVDLLEDDFASLLQSCAAAGPESMQKCIKYILPEMMEQCYTLSASTRRTVESWVAAMTKGTEMTIAQPDELGMLDGQLKLKSLALTKEETTFMLNQLSSMASVEPAKARLFDSFKNWIASNGPFDVILDGANIGYFNAFSYSEVLQWSQIERVARHFMQRGLAHTIPPQPRVRVLVILHERHFKDEKRLHPKDQEIIRRFRDRGMLYTTPRRMNDDLFWLYAGVSATIANPNAMIVSCDQMRDHHFQMLSMKHFLKWRERHLVEFDFSDAHWSTMPTFAFPSPYSIRMQPVDGAWCFPLNDMESPVVETGFTKTGNYTGQWLVVRPGQSQMGHMETSLKKSETPVQRQVTQSETKETSLRKPQTLSRKPKAPLTTPLTRAERTQVTLREKKLASRSYIGPRGGLPKTKSKLVAIAEDLGISSKGLTVGQLDERIRREMQSRVKHELQSQRKTVFAQMD